MYNNTSSSSIESAVADLVGISGILIFVSIVWFLLCVVLFFKIWGMTNDVRKIKEMIEDELYVEEDAGAKPRTSDKTLLSKDAQEVADSKDISANLPS